MAHALTSQMLLGISGMPVVCSAAPCREPDTAGAISALPPEVSVAPRSKLLTPCSSHGQPPLSRQL